MKMNLQLGCALIATAMACPMTAQAASFVFNFGGPGNSGTLNVTYEPNPNTGPLGTSPNAYDPVGSFIITDVTGKVSNSALKLNNAAVTGLIPLNKVSPESTNLLAPNSFSLLPVASGIPTPGGGTSLGFHYTNLFYPGGSPQTASDYPAAGGVFDIYGMAFTIAGGQSVNFWSNGAFFPGGPLDYGIGFTDGQTVLSYGGGIQISAVPEPQSWALMIVGFGGVGYAIRRRGRKALRPLAA